MRQHNPLLHLTPDLPLSGLLILSIILLCMPLLSGCGGSKFKGLVMDETAIEEPPPAPPGFTEALTLSPSAQLSAEPEDDELTEDGEDIPEEDSEGENIQTIQGAEEKEDVKLDTDLKTLKNIKENSQDVNKEIKRVESQAEKKAPVKTPVAKQPQQEAEKPEPATTQSPAKPVASEPKPEPAEDSQAIPETVIKLPMKKDASRLKIDTLDPPP